MIKFEKIEIHPIEEKTEISSYEISTAFFDILRVSKMKRIKLTAVQIIKRSHQAMSSNSNVTIVKIKEMAQIIILVGLFMRGLSK